MDTALLIVELLAVTWVLCIPRHFVLCTRRADINDFDTSIGKKMPFFQRIMIPFTRLAVHVDGYLASYVLNNKFSVFDRIILF